MASAPSNLAENNSLSRARATHMFILFDSNVWFSQLGLQSRSGAAVRHFALRRGATVVVPEIVRLEIEERLTGHLLKLRKQAADSHKQLLQVFHKLQRLTLPLEDDIRGVVSRIVSNFDVPVREVEFNVDVARSSMIKIIRRIPPSKTREEVPRQSHLGALSRVAPRRRCVSCYARHGLLRTEKLRKRGSLPSWSAR